MSKYLTLLDVAINERKALTQGTAKTDKSPSVSFVSSEGRRDSKNYEAIGVVEPFEDPYSDANNRYVNKPTFSFDTKSRT
jgi:hypothetical protein